MAINMPQTVKAQTNVASAQNTTTNNEEVQQPVTFNTATSSNSVEEKAASAVQPQTTETTNNAATVQPQSAAVKPVAQGSAKTVSSPSMSNNQNDVEPVASQSAKVSNPVQSVKSNNQVQSVTKPQNVQNVQVENDASKASNNNVTPEAPKAVAQNVTVNNSVKSSSSNNSKETFNTTASEIAPKESLVANVNGIDNTNMNVQANAVKGVAAVNGSVVNNDDNSDKSKDDSDKSKQVVIAPLELADQWGESIPATLNGNGNEIHLPQDNQIYSQKMTMTCQGHTSVAYCLQPLAYGPLEVEKSNSSSMDVRDNTSVFTSGKANQLAGVLYYGAGGPKAVVGDSDQDYIYTHVAASIAAWNCNYMGMKDYESKSTSPGHLTQAQIDQWSKIPEVAKIISAANNWTPQTLDKDGYTMTEYDGHGVNQANPNGINDSQGVMMISWNKKPAPKPTQPTHSQTSGQKKSYKTTTKTQKTTQPTQKTTQPTQKTTQPTQKTTQPTQKPTQPTQKTTQPTQKVTQPVTQPISIGTTLTGTNGHQIAISSNATATDTVDYKNLQVGKKYTMKGTLMDKKTGKPVMQNGQPVTASTTFTPTSANGSVNVVFHFNDTDVAGDSLVAYEDLYDQNNNKVVSHDDINDQSETDTVEKPEIGTTLVGTNGHEIAISKSAIATDTVNYNGLIPGQKYTMTGTLMDKATGKPVMNNGKSVTASTTFTPQKANGSVNVVFHLDDTNYAGDSLVAYEDLTDSNGNKIASHDNINDQSETDTVERPEIGTTLVGSDGTHLLPFSNNVIATDTVAYKDLIPGKKYTMKGTLMDKNTGKPVMENGQPVIAETTFTPTSANGTVKLSFTLNDEALAGDSLVAYEDLYDENGNEIVAHDNINDQSETDTVQTPTPSMGTTLVGSNGTHELQIGDETTAVDTVAYHNLIPGKQYKLVGTLMDKATGKPVMNNGKPVTATTIFTPTTPDGVATVTFHFNDKGYEGHALVAYEDLYDAKTGKLLLRHDDINDLSETDTVKKPKKHTPMIQYQTQSQNVYVSSPASPVVKQAASPAPVVSSPASPVVEQAASSVPAAQAAPAQGAGQGQGLPETADTSSLTGEALAAAAALAGVVMLFKNREDDKEA